MAEANDWANQIDPEFGMTNGEVERLRELLENADYCDASNNPPELHALGRKAFEAARNQNNG